MSEGNQIVRNDLLGHLNKKRQKSQELENQKAAIESQLVSLEADMKALERVLLLYPNGQKPTEVVLNWANVAQQFRGKTQMEILKTLARESEGIIHYSQAAKFLREFGLSEANPKNLGSHIYTILKESTEWERVSPGTFRLLGFRQNAQPSLPGVS